MLGIFLALPVFAQVDTGIDRLVDSGLGGTDIRVTIANIIRIFLGVLGAIAVAITLYGGFLWMTAAGNEDKITKAKQLLVNAAIGLAIILAAYGIVSFAISRLLDATGAGGGDVGISDDDGRGGGRLPADAFTVRSIQPQGKVPIRNITVRLLFTRGVDPATVKDNITVVVGGERIIRFEQVSAAVGKVVAGTYATDGAVVTFTPSAACPAPNEDRKCFDADTSYRVTAKARGVKSVDGKELLCGIGGVCTATFTSGTLVDTEPPTIVITEPTTGAFVSADADVPIVFDAKDDAGIALVEADADGARIGSAMPSGNTKTEFQSSILWNTKGKAPGTTHTLQARAFDLDQNPPGVSPTITVRLRAAHCFNAAKDADETDVDCGGKDCGDCATGGGKTGGAQLPGAPPSGVSGTPPGTGTGGTTGGGRLPADAFTVQSIQPQGKVPIRNIAVRLRFTKAVDPKTVEGNITVAFTDTTLSLVDNTPKDGIADGWTLSGVHVPSLPDDTTQQFGGQPFVGGFAETNILPMGGGTYRISMELQYADHVNGTNALRVDLLDKTGSKLLFIHNRATTDFISYTATVSVGDAARLQIRPHHWHRFYAVRNIRFERVNAAAGTVVAGAYATDGAVVTFTPSAACPAPNEDRKCFDADTPYRVTAKARGVKSVDGKELLCGIGGVCTATFTSGTLVDTEPPTTETQQQPPRIDIMEPEEGAPGTYVTLRGSNFGASGTVSFESNSAGIRTVAETSFPAACGNRFWTPTSITVKVPAVALGGYEVRVKTGILESNAKHFVVNNRALTPGICRIDPDNGPVGLGVTIEGERFGTTPGKIVFFNEKQAASKTWDAGSVTTNVPLGAATGFVRLVDGKQTKSNTLPFTVRDCRSGGSCGSGNECCGDGACRERGACGASAAQCTFAWKFTTGAGSGGGDACDPVTGICDDTIPHVVEQQSCERTTQSPSPYRDTKDACVNTAIAVRFTMNMHDATLAQTKNITVTSCNTGVDLKKDACSTTPIPVTFSQWIAHDTTGEGVIYMPEQALSADVWYRVQLSGGAGGITSANGIPLDGDRDGKPGGNYEWFFHTENTSCAVEKVMVTPRAVTITQWRQQDFTGIPSAKNCNILDPNSVVWNWSSGNTKKVVLVAPDASSKTTASPVFGQETFENGVDTPVDIRGAVDKKIDAGQLSIRYPPPRVIAQWPSCNAACTNAEIGIRFSEPVRVKIFGSSAGIVLPAIQLFACQPISEPAAIANTALRIAATNADAAGARAIVAGESARDTGNVSRHGDQVLDSETTTALNAAVDAGRSAVVAMEKLDTTVKALLTQLGAKATPAQTSNANAVGAALANAKRFLALAETASQQKAIYNVGHSVAEVGRSAKESAAKARAVSDAGDSALQVCNSQALIGPLKIRSIIENTSTHTFRIFPAPNVLRPDTYYRVLVAGSDSSIGVRGANGKHLEIPNPFIWTDGNRYYSWIFRTKSGPEACAIASVGVEPEQLTVHTVGEPLPYSSTALGAPDACAPEGQRLDSFVYGWQWQSTRPNVATITNLNILPLPPEGPDNNIDPEQQATAEREGVTDIRATTGGLQGAGTLRVICGYTNDNQCPAGFGVDAGTCCAPRPKLVRSFPDAAPKQTNLCRNSVLEAEFDQLMSDTSFTGNAVLMKKGVTGESGVPARFEITTVTDTTTQARRSLLRFTPETPLDPDTEYEWRLFGARQQASENIKSARGVALGKNIIIAFRTRAGGLCTFGSVAIRIKDVERATNDFFSCAKPSGCADDDDAAADGNQHDYRATVKSSDGQPLALTNATITWDSRFAGETTFALEKKTATSVVVTAQPKNGDGEVTYTARGSQGEGTVAATVQAQNFLCENPWPSLAAFPWKERATNFSFFYCRDAGAPGFSDDLPPLQEPVQVPHPTEQEVLKEFLLPVMLSP